MIIKTVLWLEVHFFGWIRIKSQRSDPDPVRLQDRVLILRKGNASQRLQRALGQTFLDFAKRGGGELRSLIYIIQLRGQIAFACFVVLNFDKNNSEKKIDVVYFEFFAWGVFSRSLLISRRIF